jgi:hypothetical protein
MSRVVYGYWYRFVFLAFELVDGYLGFELVDG